MRFLSRTFTDADTAVAPAALTTLSSVAPNSGTGFYLVKAVVIVTEAAEPSAVNCQIAATGEFSHDIPTVRDQPVVLDLIYELDEAESILLYTIGAAAAGTRYTTLLSATKIQR